MMREKWNRRSVGASNFLIWLLPSISRLFHFFLLIDTSRNFQGDIDSHRSIQKCPWNMSIGLSFVGGLFTVRNGNTMFSTFLCVIDRLLSLKFSNEKKRLHFIWWRGLMLYCDWSRRKKLAEEGKKKQNDFHRMKKKKERRSYGYCWKGNDDVGLNILVSGSFATTVVVWVMMILFINKKKWERCNKKVNHLCHIWF